MRQGKRRDTPAPGPPRSRSAPQIPTKGKRLQTAAPDSRTALSRNRAASRAARGSRRRARAGLRPPAMPRGRRSACRSGRILPRSGQGRRSARPGQVAPPIALTLRRMNWIRRQGTRGWGRSTLLLSSVLALLALACFPVLAQAGSGTIEYDPALPGDGGAKQNENIAKSSESPNSGGAEAPASGGSGESYSEEVPPSSESQGTANTGNTGNADNDGGTGQGNP